MQVLEFYKHQASRIKHYPDEKILAVGVLGDDGGKRGDDLLQKIRRNDHCLGYPE